MKIHLSEKIGYGLGDMSSSMFWKLFGAYLMIFYTDVFGISAAVVGTMFAITRVWDSFFDPIVGVMADRTTSRWGHFRPYLLYLALKINKYREIWVMIGLWSILVFLHRVTGAQPIFYGLPELCWYFIYFSLGYATHKYKSQALKILRPIGWVGFVVFPLLLFFSVDKSHYILDSLRLYALALTGIAASYVLWEGICHSENKATQCLKYLGSISLEIYVTHYYMRFLVDYIKKYIGDNFYLNVVIFTVLAVIACDIIQRLIQRVKWLRRILYGRF